MLSGSGRTLLNLLDAINDGRLNATIPLVIASKECLGAQRARERGLTTRIIEKQIPPQQLNTILQEHEINLVALAGYLQLIQIPPAYKGRIVNIHPALLPKFGGTKMYGHRVHEAVLQSGELESGCTVHLCDEQYDKGRILLQQKCPILPDDTPETLAARVFELECQAYPQALQHLIDQGVSSAGTGSPGEA